MPIPKGWGHIFEGQLLIKRGDVAAGVRCLRTGLDELHEARFVLHRSAPLGALAEGLAGVGQVSNIGEECAARGTIALTYRAAQAGCHESG
jgi:hypothetical protein